MRRKLTVSLVGVGGALALALAFAVPASSVDAKVDAFGCRLFIIDGKPKTVCSRQ